MKRTALLLLCGALAPSALAQTSDGASYVPDTIEFDGSGGVSYPSDPVLALDDGGAIEFWVAADWKTDPGYDPVVLSNENEDVPAYRVMVAADRRSLLLQVGSKSVSLPADLSDGAMHHIAFVDTSEDIYLMVDGQLEAGVETSIEAVPTDLLWIGAGGDNAAPFLGAIAAVRIWDIAVDVETLVKFAFSDALAAADPHPDLDYLVGYSDFRTNDFYITESFALKTDDLAADE